MEQQRDKDTLEEPRGKCNDLSSKKSFKITRSKKEGCRQPERGGAPKSWDSVKEFQERDKDKGSGRRLVRRSHDVHLC